jgi:hypothetical protein
VEEGRRFRDRLLTPDFYASIPAENREYRLSAYADFLEYVAEDEPAFLKAIELSTSKLSSPVMNFQSAETLRRLSAAPQFAPEQKAVLARAAWTRDFARGQAPNSKATAAMLAVNPELDLAFKTAAEEFKSLKPDQLRLLTMLRNPRFGILVNSPDWSDVIETKRADFSEIDLYDPNDKNWWCPYEPDRQLLALRVDYDQQSGVGPATDYYAAKLKPLVEPDAVAMAATIRDKALAQHPMIKAVNWKELKALASSPSAPAALSRAAIRWGKSAKADNAAAAEALALAVRATRYGCRWHGGHKAYSKPAQELLKNKFAASPWTAKTPYWFDCMNQQWDDKGNKVPNCKPQAWAKQAPLNAATP